MRAPLLRPPRALLEERLEERLLDLRADDLRPVLRRDEDLRPPARRDDDLRPPPELRPLERFRAPPPLRREEPPALFLPPLERLDFLAAAIGKLRVAGFVERIARFAHKKAAIRRIHLYDLVPHYRD